MSSRISRYAAVAALAAVVMMGVTFLGGRSGRPGAAWAIEQTIQALQEIRTIHCRGMMTATIPGGKYLEIPFDMWARAKDGSNPGDSVFDTMAAQKLTLKDESGSAADVGMTPLDARQLTVKRGEVVYRYSPKDNLVEICEGNTFTAFDPWPGADYFQKIRSKCSSWQEEYGRDRQTGRESVFVTCTCDGAKVRFEFDVETKLPVRVEKEPQGAGQPGVVIDLMEYNVDVPEGKFEFTIPPGAKVVDGRQKNEQ